MLQSLTSYLSQPVTPGEAGNYIWATIYVVIVIAGVSVVVLIMNWGERKALAKSIQNKVVRLDLLKRRTFSYDTARYYGAKLVARFSRR